jgi:prepilin signal peptidase PulO-like enzyme (type II secretory pathway)
VSNYVLAPAMLARNGRALAAVVAAFAGVGVVARYGFESDVIVPLVAVPVLVLLSVHDLERRNIPNRIVLPAWAFALFANIALHPSHTVEWTLSSVAAAAFFFVFARLTHGGVGMGDVKLVGFIGAVLGRDVFPALLIGTGASGLLAALILLQHGKAARRRTYAFGPFLAGGALVVLLFL